MATRASPSCKSRRADGARARAPTPSPPSPPRNDRYDDFIVRKITIRYKTFSEIFGEVGGLWAGCAALLWLVWKKSGYLRKKDDGSTGEEMMIFKYIPCKSWKDEWLDKGVPKDDPQEAGGERRLSGVAAPVRRREASSLGAMSPRARVSPV